jgi:hypothetical protein
MTSTPPPPVDSYKNYKSRDKEYNRLYNKQLWEEKLGIKTPCERCGKVVNVGGMMKHHRTAICERTRINGENKLKNTHSDRIKVLEDLVLQLQGKI